MSQPLPGACTSSLLAALGEQTRAAFRRPRGDNAEMVDLQAGPRASRPILNMSEAASLIGVAKSTLYEWLQRGVLPGVVRVGRRYYVRREALERWLKGEVA